MEAEYWRVSTEMLRIVYAGFSPAEVGRVRAMPHPGSGEPVEGRGGSLGEEGSCRRRRGHGARNDDPGLRAQGVARPEEREDLRSSLLRRIAVLCPFVGSAVGSRCLTARGYNTEIEWVWERDGWSTFGLLT